MKKMYKLEDRSEEIIHIVAQRLKAANMKRRVEGPMKNPNISNSSIMHEQKERGEEIFEKLISEHFLELNKCPSQQIDEAH